MTGEARLRLVELRLEGGDGLGVVVRVGRVAVCEAAKLGGGAAPPSVSWTSLRVEERSPRLELVSRDF
jgi:hypothetical protein